MVKRKAAAPVNGSARPSGEFLTEMWPIDKPIDYPKNARKWTQQAIDKVAMSIREFGWRQPVVVDSQGVIVIGHLRRLAGKSIGCTECPVHVARDLSPEKIRALRLADNRSGQEATWDMDLLASEFLDLKGLDIDLSFTAFDTKELDALLLTPNAAEDDVPPVPEVPTSRLGDLWVMGGHRLLCGDCRDLPSVMRVVEGGVCNLVVTSPPYAEQREYDESSGFRPIPPDEYVEWFQPIADNIRSVMASDGSYFLNIKPSCEGVDTQLYVLDLVLAHARQWGWHFATEFCWERNGVPKSVTQRFKNQFEPVYQFSLGRWKMRPDAVRHYSPNVPTASGPGSGETSWAAKQGGKGATSVPGSFGAVKKRRNGTNHRMAEMQGQNVAPGDYVHPGMAYPGNRLPSFNASHEATGHVAAFPVGLPQFFIEAYTDPGDVVFDPFAGSGSTLIAAENTSRRGHGIELSPAYCDVIVTRWQNLTGKQAVLGDGDYKGATFEHAREGRLREWEDAIGKEAFAAQEATA
jgi:DNA modification methylase